MMEGARRIGLLLNDTISDYVKEIVDGVSSICDEKSASLFLFNVGELNHPFRPFDYHQKALAQFCNKNNIDGLVICSGVLGNNCSKEELEEYVHSFDTIPVVSIGAKIPNVPSVFCDARPGLEEILDDFVDHHKCKRICLLGKIPGSEEAVERTEIITRYLKEKGFPFDERCVIEGNFTYEGAMNALDERWEKKAAFDFDAIVALNDDMAFAALDFCEKRKIKVPEQVKIAGFDDVSRSELCHPSLTTVNQSLFNQGADAAKILFDIFERKNVSLVNSVHSSARFRKSCSCMAANEFSFGAYVKKGEDGSRAALYSRLLGTEWLDKKRQFHVLNDFLISGQSRLNLAKMRRLFMSFTERFDIKAAALCLYDTPIYVNEKKMDFCLPEKASVYASFDKRKDYVQNINEEPIHYDPNKCIVPDGIFDWAKDKYLVWIVSNCETQYGYIVYRQGSYESLVYSMMCATFSRLVSGAWEGTRAEKAAKSQQERTAQLNLISKTDELTGLLNRRGFLELGQQTIDIAVVLNQGGMVIFGDMDGLKYINDTFGHDAGDRAIKAEAEILKKNFRASDIVGRLGGDEFVVIAAGLGEPRLSVIRENIDAACKAWNIVHNEGFELSISLGCKAFNKDLPSLEDILKEADSLLYEEKRAKKNARRS
ncbi:MAG: GGDEF domain-containing protein [Treponema sp.]|nr:GGDEF domain-containing protein [Treponema sp.]